MSKKGSQTWVLVLGAIIVVALFTVPAALKAGGEAWSSFWKDFWLPFAPDDDGDDGNANATNALSGGGCINLEIFYKDGSSRKFTATQLNILPLTISDGAGAIASIKAHVSAKITYEGTLSVWTVDVRLIAEIRDALGSTVIGTAYDATEKNSGAEWQSNTDKILTLHEISASAIESNLHADGNYSLKITAKVKLDVRFQDGSIDQMLGQDSALWVFKRTTSGLESLSVTLVYTPA